MRECVAPSRRRRNHAKMVCLVGENKKRKAKAGTIASTKGESDDQECGRQGFCTHARTHSMERRNTDLEEEEDARLLDRCEEKEKEWATHWQCDVSVQDMKDKPWKHEELKKLEEALPRPKKSANWEKVSRLYNTETKINYHNFHPKAPSSLDLTKETRGQVVELLEKGGTKWNVAATSLYDDVLLDTEECHECEADCATADVDVLVGSSESTRSGDMAAEVSCSLGRC